MAQPEDTVVSLDELMFLVQDKHNYLARDGFFFYHDGETIRYWQTEAISGGQGNTGIHGPGSLQEVQAGGDSPTDLRVSAGQKCGDTDESTGDGEGKPPAAPVRGTD